MADFEVGKKYMFAINKKVYECVSFTKYSKQTRAILEDVETGVVIIQPRSMNSSWKLAPSKIKRYINVYGTTQNQNKITYVFDNARTATEHSHLMRISYDVLKVAYEVEIELDV